MNLPTLTREGLIDRPPELFRSAIAYTLDQCINQLAPECEDWVFLEGASLVAAEVYASGSDWEPIRDRYSQAACRLGMAAAEAEELLSLAWSCAPHRAARWIEMTREWVRLKGEGAIAHVKSGVTVPAEYLGQIFSDIFEDPSCELGDVFFNSLVEVSHLTSQPSWPPGFQAIGDEIVFNRL